MAGEAYNARVHENANAGPSVFVRQESPLTFSIGQKLFKRKTAYVVPREYSGTIFCTRSDFLHEKRYSAPGMISCAKWQIPDPFFRTEEFFRRGGHYGNQREGKKDPRHQAGGAGEILPDFQRV
ncbi:MAG: hypothetical protein LUF35_01195 [Lachnospiraceae bacterium]|nr:hypothetical protein [Lachnospiraceae bacterium]